MSERDTIAPDTCGKDGRPRDEICRVTCADSCPFNRPKTTIKRRERASLLAQAIVSRWREKDAAVPSLAETIDVAITARDEEWRAWLERLKYKLGYRLRTQLERDDPPPDKR
jgi:hypothetical protein